MESIEAPLTHFWFKNRIAIVGDCWIWQRATINSGYGKLKAEGRWWTAHKYVYTKYVGPVPSYHVVRHMCHNKLCVNPKHLSIGTPQENVIDQIERGTLKPPRGKLKPLEYYRRFT